MRYHTAPLIGFTAYLENLRKTSRSADSLFQDGNQFKCYVKDMKIMKSNSLEREKKYRRYSLSFTYGGYGGNAYTFRLAPEFSIFKHTVEGLAVIKGSNRYRIKRSSAYQETHVNFTVGSPKPTIDGSYYNWHSEQGEFFGEVKGDRASLTAKGAHYRRDKSSPYYQLSPNERITTWNFEIPFESIKLPRTT